MSNIELNLKRKEKMQKQEASDNFSKLIGTELVGKHGHYRLLKDVGSGGNGTVFDVLIKESSLNIAPVQNGYVIKVLTTYDYRDKREKRFKKEILTVNELQKDIKGILPIIDYSLGDNDKGLLWYLMPKGKVFYAENLTDVEKLACLRHLGNTIVQLHKEKHAHRDIKPENILVYNKETFLSDFGLVWDSYDDQNLTSIGEGIGPSRIRPPELDAYSEKAEDFDFRVSDIYLFAKTLWIMLSKCRNGFRGEYSRGDSAICLNHFSLNLGSTLEPLHKLLDGATKHDYADRISINECLELIDLQIKVCEGELSETEINKLRYEEKIGLARAKNKADDSVYRDTTKILDVCNRLHGVAELVIDNGIKQLHLGILKKSQFRPDGIYILTLRDFRSKKDVYVLINQITIRNDNSCFISLKRFQQLPEEIRCVNSINELERVLDKRFCLSIDINICLVNIE